MYPRDEIVRETERVTGAEVDLVTGGFHLRPYSARAVSELAHKMKEDLGVLRVAPTHCTGDRAIQMFRQAYGPDFVQMGVGRILKIEAVSK